nr:family 16 glycosylhydrolase [Bacteroidales bacterium]
MNIRICFALVFFFILNSAKSQDNGVFVRTVLLNGQLDCSSETWKLVFHDEFNGTSLDQSKWRSSYCDGGCRTHGNEAQIYLDENVVLSNGKLKLIAKKENVTWNGISKAYSSGMIMTKDPFPFFKGKFEIKAKIPYGMGFWPAFWLYGHEANEIDVFEFGCDRPESLYTNVHTEETGSHLDWSIEHDNNINYSSKSHIYSVEWDTEQIIFKVDNTVIREMYRYTTSLGQALVCPSSYGTGTYLENILMPDNNMDIILNLAIASASTTFFTNPPNSSTVFPNAFEIDYVRVYQRTPQSGFSDLCANREIIGASKICNGVSKTYTFNGPFEELSWNVSSKLLIVNTTDNSVTVRPVNQYAKGSASIVCEDIGSICNETNFTKNISVGGPNFGSAYVKGPTQLTPGLSAVYSVSPAQGATSYEWEIPSGCYAHYCWKFKSGQYSNVTNVQAGKVGSGVIECTAKNTCGTDSRYLYINVQNPYGGGGGGG